ncbi:hypothetical protein EIP91_001455 [Steccherinum ochraceum]|uniref:Uncharacterized protein n=1 Tax=Steccherinum ochraceum TaxID=92696 RepID=A0A4R0RE09_9APHY|nr:hypothetical protein EIP91_001455 [Steccherinum ochraceum]
MSGGSDDNDLNFQSLCVILTFILIAFVTFYPGFVLVAYVTLGVLFFRLPFAHNPRFVRSDGRCYDSFVIAGSIVHGALLWHILVLIITRQWITVGQYLLSQFDDLSPTIVCPPLPPDAGSNTRVAPIIEPADFNANETADKIAIDLFAAGWRMLVGSFIIFISPITYQLVLKSRNIPVDEWGEMFLKWLSQFTDLSHLTARRRNAEAHPVEAVLTVHNITEPHPNLNPNANEQTAGLMA